MSIRYSPQVAEFLAKPVYHFVDGQFLGGADSRLGEAVNPSDGTFLTKVAMGGAEDIEQAVRAAEKAFLRWANLSPSDRAIVMHRFAEALGRHAAELAELESLDVGKSITAAEGFDVPFGIECLRYFAKLSLHTQPSRPLAIKNIEARSNRVPFGVCGFIFPWNFPFLLLMWGVAPALAAGNTVVVKCSEVTPLTSLYTARIAREAGLPDGVLNIVVGEGPTAGAALANHPRIKRMSFTGSPKAGRLVGEACGRNLVPCKLELGGKGAAVIFDDVDVETVATKLAGAITLNTGQVCCTATRWLVHEKIYDSFAEKVVAALKRTKIGPAIERDTEMGPLVSQVQRQRVLSYIERGESSGAKVILAGGSVSPHGAENGFYVEPTLLEGPEDNICCREEIFGPCAYLLRFKDETAVISQVNSISYGLANSVWSSDLRRAERVAERMVAGNSWINAHNVFAYGLPYGGVNLSGYGGGVNSPETYHDYLRPQTIARPLNGT